jgi:integrase
MSKGISCPPRYCRQKEKSRADRAYVVIDGQRISLGAYGSAESYKRYADAISGSSATGEQPAPKPAPSAPTIIMLMAHYLKHASAKYGERGSEVVHLKSICRMMRSLCGTLPAKNFGPKRFKELRELMIGAGWSRGYIRDQCGRVKRMIAWGVSEEILPPHARHALDAVSGLAEGEAGVRETDEVDAVPDAVVEATIKHVGQTVRDMTAIQRLTGMRPGELVQLAAEHIDRKNEIWLFRPPKHKTKKKGKKRFIAIGPRAQAILQKYLFSTPCFPYSTASYRRAIARGCDRAFLHPAIAAIVGGDQPARKKMLTIAAKKRELKGALAKWQSEHRWHPHQIRHTAAEEVREAFGLEHTQHVLGHAKADVTQIYAKGNIQKAVEVARQIG